MINALQTVAPFGVRGRLQRRAKARRARDIKTDNGEELVVRHVDSIASKNLTPQAPKPVEQHRPGEERHHPGIHKGPDFQDIIKDVMKGRVPYGGRRSAT
ncbi:MAG: hypothetical protein HQL50_05890 [Magnetococcales bacterium]|nr:hypothetical protein [Magnetococcales bacterium]